MSDQMNTEIRDAIARGLPAAMGDELRKVLAKGEADARALEIARRNLAEKDATISTLSATVAKAHLDLERAGDLDKREVAVAERERAQEIAALRVQLASANDNTKFARDVALGLVRNVEFREQSMRSNVMPVAMSTPGGNSFIAQAETKKTDDVIKSAS